MPGKSDFAAISSLPANSVTPVASADRHGAAHPVQQASAWLVAQLKPNSEAIAKRHLLRQGFVLFAPFEELTERRASTYRTIRKPLFPGYVFVSLDPDSAHWRKVNSTLGVCRLVSFSTGKPAFVPATLIADLMDRCDDEGRLLAPDGLAPGDRVRITQGPFAEFVATVEQLAPQQRVWVLLDIMGKSTRVVLKPSDVSLAG